jgi:hypothetical protein
MSVRLKVYSFEMNGVSRGCAAEHRAYGWNS